MAPFMAMFMCQARLALHYRAAAIAGILTQIFFGIVRMQVLMAFYRGSDAQAPIDAAAAQDYIWLSQATLALLPMRPDPELAEMIRSGRIAGELLRPVDCYWLWFARTQAQVLVPLLLRSVPLLSVALVLGWLRPPVDAASAALWLLSLLPALLLSAAFRCLMGLVLFWTVAGQGLILLSQAGVWSLAGIALPLPLFPDFLQPLLYLLPFKAFFDTPALVYTGTLQGVELLGAFGHQIVWVLVLIGIGRLLTRRGLRALTIAGG